ncbi:hypothetical protein [Shinella kummerowiae]|uniref:hypothetical protein n=1 Tax=Shinella kummerowiae TaxID=417745 RepID=UPI0021B5A305|nr:hypothetical protein [Shinella kummerowiae]MCT7662317.1 hypothetical protein [Shinella kummerowiae]
MTVKTFTANEEWNAGLEARSDAGYRMLSYNGSLGGGTLQIFTQGQGGAPKVAVPDSKLSAAKVDSNGDPIQQVVFISAGNVWVHLTGATAPNVTVVVE